MIQKRPRQVNYYHIVGLNKFFLSAIKNKKKKIIRKYK